jgi:hypothetical protein
MEIQVIAFLLILIALGYMHYLHTQAIEKLSDKLDLIMQNLPDESVEDISTPKDISRKRSTWRRIQFFRGIRGRKY